MKRLCLLFLSLLGLSGCGTLQMDIVVQRDGKANILRGNEGLVAGDRFSLRLRVPEDAYVYVARSRPEQSTQSLYPLEQPVKVPAGSVQSIPLDGSTITLDTLQPGEQLCVLLSKAPIAGALKRCPGANDVSAGRDADTKGGHHGIGQRPESEGVRILPLRVSSAARLRAGSAQ